MEEQEWAKRALLAGYKIVYDGDAAVFHSHRRALVEVLKWYFECGAGLSVVHWDPIINYSMRKFIIDGMIFVWRENVFMFKNRYWYWFPYALIYDMLKFLGVFLGSNHKYMPLWMKRALSNQKNYWDNYKNVIKDPV